MKTALLLLLFPLTTLAAPPVPTVPTVPPETKMALAITMTQSTNSEAYRLSQYYLKGIVEPSYYSNAIKQVMSSNTMASVMSNANVVAKAVVAAAQPAVITITNGLKYSNQPTAYRIPMGQVQVINGVTNGWNVVDIQPNEYYPAYNLQSATSLTNGAFSNLASFPAGSEGFTNNEASTSPNRFYRIRYDQ